MLNKSSENKIQFRIQNYNRIDRQKESEQFEDFYEKLDKNQYTAQELVNSYITELEKCYPKENNELIDKVKDLETENAKLKSKI